MISAETVKTDRPIRVKLEERFADTFILRDGRWKVVANYYVRADAKCRLSREPTRAVERGHISAVEFAAILFPAEHLLRGESMSSLKEFQCEICGIVSENPVHWFVIECGDQKLELIKWDLSAATRPTARHFCGEAHAQVYISRWLESVCGPPRQVLKAI